MTLTELFKFIDESRDKYLEEHLNDINQKTEGIFEKINETLIAGIELHDESLHKIFCENIKGNMTVEYNNIFEILKKSIKDIYDFDEKNISFETFIDNSENIRVKTLDNLNSEKQEKYNQTYLNYYSSSIVSSHTYRSENERSKRDWSRPGYAIDINFSIDENVSCDISLEGHTQLGNSSSHTRATTRQSYRDKKEDLAALEKAFDEINEQFKKLLLNKKNDYLIITERKKKADAVVENIITLSKALSKPADFIETRKIDENTTKEMQKIFKDNFKFFEGLNNEDDLKNAYQLILLTTDTNLSQFSVLTPYVEKRGRPATKRRR